MHELVDMTKKRKKGGGNPEEWLRLRKGLLLVEREKTRIQGQRLLEKIVEMRNVEISSVAQAGLASSFFWGNDYRQAMYWSRQTMAFYPMTVAAIWSSSLLITMFRALGMKRERFEAERERIRMMRKIAFQSENRDAKIYVLNELLKELDARDLAEDVQFYAKELEDLVKTKSKVSASALV